MLPAICYYLIILTACGLEDLHGIKLILYFFEGISGLAINFQKTFLFSTKYCQLPNVSFARTLNCMTYLFPFTYLGIPISVRRPHHQDWDSIVHKVSSQLTSWKSKLLSLGDRITLVNTVLTSIPTY